VLSQDSHDKGHTPIERTASDALWKIRFAKTTKEEKYPLTAK